MSIDGKHIWSIRPMEYSAIKSNEVLIRDTTNMNLENIMLHDKQQTQKPRDSIHIKHQEQANP